MIRTKLHTLGLFPPVPGEPVKGCVRKSEGRGGDRERGGTFRERGRERKRGGDKRRCDCEQRGRREAARTCLTFRLVLLHKYFSPVMGG